MVEHLENHPHSFIKNGTVIQVLIFDDHDKDLLEVFKNDFEADEVVCGCDVGEFGTVDGTWDGSSFKEPQPFPSWTWNAEVKGWEPPIPYPGSDTEHYWWNESSLTWDKITE